MQLIDPVSHPSWVMPPPTEELTGCVRTTATPMSARNLLSPKRNKVIACQLRRNAKANTLPLGVFRACPSS